VDRSLKLLQMQTQSEQIVSGTIVERGVTMLTDAPTLVVNLSSSRPRKRRKCIRKIEDGHDPDLDGYYMEE
jgi:predicted RNase H-like nuclease